MVFVENNITQREEHLLGEVYHTRQQNQVRIFIAKRNEFRWRQIFLAYLEKIKLAQAMRSLSGGKAINSIFPVHHILLYLIIGWMLGCERIFHFRKLQHDALLIRFLGGRCPHHSLLYKELGRLGRSCPGLATELRTLNQEIIRPSLPLDIILDLDSTVETVYGGQAVPPKGPTRTSPVAKAIIRCWLLKDKPV